MTKLIVTRGLPGSGKTTWAKEQVSSVEPGTLVRLNRDDVRDALHGGWIGTYRTEEQVSLIQHRGIEDLLRSGTSVIVDDMNLRARYVRRLAEIAWRVGVEFEVKDFTNVPVDLCIARDSERESPVGEARIRELHGKFLAGHKLPLPVPEISMGPVGRPYIPSPKLPAAVMVDIDGTVALHDGVRDPYDTTRYHLDNPNSPVIDVVRAMYRAGRRLVFCSGRDEAFRGVTETWLRKHLQVPFEVLHMRPEGDKRRDDVVKLELFDKYIRHIWNVICVLDDRDRVVNAWRSIGLTVLQVAPGDF